MDDDEIAVNEGLNHIEQTIAKYRAQGEMREISAQEFAWELLEAEPCFEKIYFNFEFAFSELPVKKIKFDYCYFKEIRKEPHFFDTSLVELSFNYCQFDAPLFFTHTKPKKPIQFDVCSFTKRVYFYYVTFYETLWIDSCIFKAKTEFSRCTFKKSVAFRECKFFGTVKFWLSNFEAYTEFWYNYFKHHVLFNKSKFCGEADVAFISTEFESVTDFERTKFEKPVSFSSAKFLGKTSFKETEFASRAEFTVVQFGKTTEELGPGEVNSSCIFDGAIFSNKVNFEVSEFNAPVIFSDALFCDDASFNRSILHDKIYFLRCVAKGIIDLHDLNRINREWIQTCKGDVRAKELIKQGQIKFTQTAVAGVVNFNSSCLESLEFSANAFHGSIMLPPLENIKTLTKSFFNVLKYQKIQAHDQVAALAVYAQEMAFYAEEVKHKKSNFVERVLLFFASFTNYGLDWRKGLCILCSCVIVLSLLGTPIIQSINTWPAYGQSFFTIALKLLYPPSLFSDWNISLAHVNAWIIVKDLFKILWSAFYGAMIYQIIRAFRKYSRSLE